MAWRPSDTQYRLYEKKRIEQLRKTYRKSQLRLNDILAQVSLTSFQRYRTEQLLTQVNAEIANLNKEAAAWSKSNIKPSYMTGVNYSGRKLKDLGVTNSIDKGALVHRQAVSVLTDEVAKDLLIANGNMQRNIARYIRATQQRIIQDKEISRALAEGLIEGKARRSVSDTLLIEMQKKMKNQQYLTINGRNYKPEKYAELVARTRTREAVTQGTVNSAIQYGVDLIQVSTHQDIDGDDICNEYEGKVFSISGTSDKYPVADRLPPFHPNCRHVVTPVTEEALARRSK